MHIAELMSANNTHMRTNARISWIAKTTRENFCRGEGNRKETRVRGRESSGFASPELPRVSVRRNGQEPNMPNTNISIRLVLGPKLKLDAYSDNCAGETIASYCTYYVAACNYNRTRPRGF